MLGSVIDIAHWVWHLPHGHGHHHHVLPYFHIPRLYNYRTCGGIYTQ